MLGTKHLSAAREAVVTAAADTRQAVILAAGLALAALLVAVAALFVARSARRPA